jgi:hypothetical protein
MKIKNIYDKIRHDMLDFASALLAANGESISIDGDVNLEYGGNTYDDYAVSLMMGPHHIDRVERGEYGAITVWPSADAPRGNNLCDYSMQEIINILSAMEKNAENEPRQEYFEITSVSRDDLRKHGFNVNEVDDDTMRKLASKMASDYCEQLFWSSMEIIAGYLDIPQEKDFLSAEDIESLEDVAVAPEGSEDYIEGFCTEENRSGAKLGGEYKRYTLHAEKEGDGDPVLIRKDGGENRLYDFFTEKEIDFEGKDSIRIDDVAW